MLVPRALCLFFFNDTATTEIYTLSLHDALPISATPVKPAIRAPTQAVGEIVIVLGRHGKTIERSEEHTSELQSQSNLVCRLLLEKKNKTPRPAAAAFLCSRRPAHRELPRLGHAS